MFNLDNYSLRIRMYIVAAFGIIGLILFAGVDFYLRDGGYDRTTVMYIEWGFVVIGGVLEFLVAHLIGRSGERRAEILVDGIQNIKNGDLSQKVVIPGRSDFSWMAFELNTARKNIANMVHTLVGGISQLNAATQDMQSVSQETVDGVLKQQAETQSVASAMTEMTTSVQEVADNASNAAEAARHVDVEAKSGKQVVLEAIDSISGLAAEVEKAAETLSSLEQDISNIGPIVDVIRAITEQTNLLALNAAIEAARAGEHGRGFAVVADEVRSLASRTHESTHEIEERIGRLQRGAMAAVKVMSAGRENAHACVDKASSAGTALDSITEMISTMDEMSAQISTAASGQSTVAEDINRSIVNISRVAERTADGARETSRVVETLGELSDLLQDSASKFQVGQHKNSQAKPA